MITTKKFVALAVAIVGLFAAQAPADAPSRTARRQPRAAQPQRIPHAQREAPPQHAQPQQHAQPHRDPYQGHRVPHRAPYQDDRWTPPHRAPYRQGGDRWAPHYTAGTQTRPCHGYGAIGNTRGGAYGAHETRTVLERVWVPPVQEARLVRREFWVPATPHRPGYTGHYDSYELVEVREGYYTDRYVTRSVCVRPGHWESVGAWMRVGW